MIFKALHNLFSPAPMTSLPPSPAAPHPFIHSSLPTQFGLYPCYSSTLWAFLFAIPSAFPPKWLQAFLTSSICSVETLLIIDTLLIIYTLLERLSSVKWQLLTPCHSVSLPCFKFYHSSYCPLKYILYLFVYFLPYPCPLRWKLCVYISDHKLHKVETICFGLCCISSAWSSTRHIISSQPVFVIKWIYQIMKRTTILSHSLSLLSPCFLCPSPHLSLPSLLYHIYYILRTCCQVLLQILL